MEKKREELLSPVVAKMQKAIDEVAKEEAYTYVFNSNATGGVSVLLHAPQQDNITEKVLKKLGVTMPAKDQPAPGAQPTGGAPK
jgi:outer membrane protein